MVSCTNIVNPPDRNLRIAIAASGICFMILAQAGCEQPAKVPTGPHFSIMTYNVNFGMPGAEQAVKAIAEADADIVCLQETTPQWEYLLRERLSGQYAHMEFRHFGGAGGQATLSKWPFTERFRHVPKDGWFPGWLVEADTPTGPVQVLNVHLRPPVPERDESRVSAYISTKQTRKRELDDLLAQLDLDSPALILGDFNENPNNPALRLAADRGFNDVLREYDSYRNTWHWRVGLITLRGQYDHILYSRHLQCLDAAVLQQGQSDHLPVVAKFQSRN